MIFPVNLRGFPPKVFIIGSQKSGTTSLANLLGNNPAICLSQPKEPNYFSVNYAKGRLWYRERFVAIDKILLDGSTTYTMCPLSSASIDLKPARKKLLGIPSRIFGEVANPKFIYLIRHPVKRAYSNYWHNVKYGYEKEDFELAFEKDMMYREQSMYFGQLLKYLEYFRRDNFLVVRFEEFVADQQKVINICENFIGLESSKLGRHTVEKNKSVVYGTIGSHLIKQGFSRKISSVLPDPVKKVLNKAFSKKIPGLSDIQIRQLEPIFAEDQKKLIETFGVGYMECLS